MNDDESSIRDDMLMNNINLIGSAGRDTGNLLHQISPPIVSQFDHLMFYDELLEDESHDYELIEEMFNSKKKIKISKDKIQQ